MISIQILVLVDGMYLRQATLPTHSKAFPSSPSHVLFYHEMLPEYAGILQTRGTKESEQVKKVFFVSLLSNDLFSTGC